MHSGQAELLHRDLLIFHLGQGFTKFQASLELVILLLHPSREL